MPSILNELDVLNFSEDASFKPYYNWNAFNTIIMQKRKYCHTVLNLIITGMPSIPLILLEY